MSTATKSRRQPKLKLFGAEPTVRPLKTAFNVGPHTRVAEVWTFAQMESAQPWERPDKATVLPGYGWMIIREPHCREEITDIEDQCDAATEERLEAVCWE